MIEAGDFYKGAHILKCKDALSFVSEYMKTKVKAENAIYIYEITSLNDNLQLMESCLKLFSEKTYKLINSPEFLSASPKTIETIFKLDTLNIDAELDLVRALEIYIKANQEAIPDIAKQVLPALRNIRWLTLPAKDIAHTLLLANHEIVNVIGCLPPEEDRSKMPPSFSVNTRKRNMSTPKMRMARQLHDKFTIHCFQCQTFNHAIWACKSIQLSRRHQLKSVYDKYKHTFMVEYNESDLQAIHDIFNELKLLD